MPVATRTITPDDLEGWVGVISLAFLEPRDTAADAAFRRDLMDYDRTYGAFDGDTCVGSFRSFATDLTLPGGTTLVASAITAVAVATTHRRRGILREIMATDLRRSVDRGEAAAVLIAAEWPIYGRYGFGATAEGATFEFDKGRGAFRDTAARHTLETVSTEQLVSVAPAVFERHRLRRPGSIDRSRPRWWEINYGITPPPGAKPWKGFAVVARDASGEAQGYMRYHGDDQWDGMLPNSTLIVDELTAATDEATRDLWRYAASVDLTVKIRAEQRPVDESIVWELTDGRAFRQTARGDFLWLRPLDVPRLLEARRYHAEDRLVLQIDDPDGLAGGTYDLEITAEGASCRRTTRSPDLRMPVGVLGSIALGGHSPVGLAAAGAIEETRRDATARLARLFWSPVAPWCNTWF